MSILLNSKFILTLIILNSLTIFINGFQIPELWWLDYFDNLLTFVFIGEAIVKIKKWSFSGYLKDPWNIFDLVIVLVSIPSLFFFLDFDFSPILILRTSRVFKVFRFFKFIPNIDRLLRGFKTALKSSFVVLISFFLYVFVIGTLSQSIFPESEYFSDPMTSIYTTIKIFSVEGWWEIPESMITPETGKGHIFFIRFYFVAILLTGGIFGLSIVNSVFIDSMLDNDSIEKKVDGLSDKLDKVLEKIDLENSK